MCPPPNREWAFLITCLGTRSLSCFALRSRAPLEGVITGVALSVEVEQIKMRMPNVSDVRRFLTGRRPSGKHGFLLNFDAELLLDTVMLRYASYPVRAFVPNPLQCFRYQAHGHVAAACRGEIQRFREVCRRAWDKGVCSFGGKSCACEL